MSPLMQAAKQTIKFLSVKSVWLYFLPWLSAVSLGMSVLVQFFPLIRPSETESFVLTVNPWVLGICLTVFAGTVVAEMVKTMRIIFFADSTVSLFLPVLTKDAVRFTAAFAKSMLFATVASVATAYAGLYAMSTFLTLPPLGLSLSMTIAAMLVPYFVIRQGLTLSAAVAGDDAGLLRSWKMTSGCGLLLSLYYLLIFMAPLLVAVSVISLVSAGALFGNFLAVLSVFVSVMAQAAFLAYLYVVLKDDA